MCGVIAVARSPESEAQVRRGLARMMHRGIRSRVVDLRGGSIGHVRLPIVGVGEENDQPVRRGPWTVGFVGEILNFREERPGDSSDVPLVVDTWTTVGPLGFRDFDGFWSVVAVDDRDGSIHALVDYLSQKPLYVRDDEYARAVASEPDAVAALGPIELDRVYMSAVMKWGYCPETWRTPYWGIRRMLPGEYLVMEAGGDTTRVTADGLVAIQSTPDDLKTAIVLAIRRRVESSDVPVSCLVSGGLDSAIVYEFGRRFGELRAYHVENGESEACRAVAPNAIVLPGDHVGLDEGLKYMQEPIDLGSLLPQVDLSDAINQTSRDRVCLTGDGADEFFGGYGRSARYDSQQSDVWHELVAWHLPRLDRVMMRNRIEVRSPFLARRVAGMALSLPRGDRTDKKILRDLFRADLPRGVADLAKRPLRTPKVADDREGRSVRLVEMFTARHEEEQPCHRSGN